MFGRFRSVKIKVPRPCCPWCQAQTEILEKRVQTLEAKIAELEGSSVFQQHTVVLAAGSEVGGVLQLVRRGIERPVQTSQQSHAYGSRSLDGPVKELPSLALLYD